MTLNRKSRLTRRAGLTASTGIVRRAELRTRRPEQAGAAGAVPPSPRRRRKAELDVPPETRAQLRQRSGDRCEAELPTVCDGPAVDVHHRKRRRDGGHAITNLVHLCRACHSWAHARPADARRLGLIVSAWDEPAEVPVALRSRLLGGRLPVLLTASGEYLTEVASWH